MILKFKLIKPGNSSMVSKQMQNSQQDHLNQEQNNTTQENSELQMKMKGDEKEQPQGGAGGKQLVSIGDGQYFELPEGYTLIQTDEGYIIGQPGSTFVQVFNNFGYLWVIY